MGCVSTQSQNRESEAGFENRVSTTQLLKKKQLYVGSNPPHFTGESLPFTLEGSLPTDSATKTPVGFLDKVMFYLLSL